MPLPSPVTTTKPQTTTQSTPAPKTGGQESERAVQLKQQLRGMTFSEQQAALAPPPEGPPPGPGGPTIQMKPDTRPDGSPLTECDDPAPLAEVGDAYALTVEQVKADIAEAAARVRRWGKKEGAATVLTRLAPLDSETITEVVGLAVAEDDEVFGKLLRNIAITDVTAGYGREVRALVAAATPEQVATAAGHALKKEQALALQVFVDALPEADRASWSARPEVKSLLKTITPDEAEAVAVDELAAADAEKKEATDDLRERHAEAAADEADKTEAANEATPELTTLRAALGAGDFVGALEGLGALGVTPEFDAAVRALDASGELTALVRGLSFAEMWNDHPHLMGRVLGARPPAKNIAEAKALLELDAINAPISDKKAARRQKKLAKGKKKKLAAGLTPEKAYGAFRMLKALPAVHREEFEAAYPDLMVKLNTALNESMREADDTNFYGTGEDDGEAIAALVVKVRDPEFWSETAPGQLGMTLKLLLKAGRRDVVKGELEAMRGSARLADLHGDTARRTAVEEALGINASDGKTPSTEGQSEADAWLGTLSLTAQLDTEHDNLNHGWGPAYFGKKHGALGALKRANKKTRKEIKANEKAGVEDDRQKSDYRWTKQLGKKGLKADNLSLDELQYAVDSLTYGIDVDFTDPEKGDDVTNEAEVAFDARAGHLEFRTEVLALDRLRFPSGGMVIETGATTMTGVEIIASWPTPANPGATQSLHVHADGVDMSDVFMTQPGMLVGLGHIDGGGVTFDLAEAALDLSDETADVQAVSSVIARHNPAKKLLTGIIQSLTNSFALNSAEGNAAEGFNASLAGLQEALVGLPAGALGTASMSVDSLSITDVAVGADTYAEKTEVEALDLVWDSRPSVIGAKRREQLGRQIAGAEEDLAAQKARKVDGEDEEKGRAERVALLERQIAAWKDEDTRLSSEGPRWEALEHLWQDVYEAKRLGGAAALEEPGVVERFEARAAELGVTAKGVDALQRALRDELSRGEGMVVSLGKVSVEGADVAGTQVDHAAATEVGIALSGTSVASHEDGGDGESKVGLVVAARTIEADGVVIAQPIDVAALLKTQARLDVLGAKAASARTNAEAKEHAAIVAQWAKPVANGKTYGETVAAVIAMARDNGGVEDLDGDGRIDCLAVIGRNAGLRGTWQGYVDALAGEPITLEKVRAQGLEARYSGSSEEKLGEVSSRTEAEATVGAIEVVGDLGGEQASTLKAEAVTGSFGMSSTTTASCETGEREEKTTSHIHGSATAGRLSGTALPYVDDVATRDVKATFDHRQATEKTGDGEAEVVSSETTGSVTSGPGQIGAEQGHGGFSGLSVDLHGEKGEKTTVKTRITGIEGALKRPGGDRQRAVTLGAMVQRRDALIDQRAKLPDDDEKAAAEKAIDAKLTALRAEIDGFPAYEADLEARKTAAEEIVAEQAKLEAALAELEAATEPAAREAAHARATALGEAITKKQEALAKIDARVSAFEQSGLEMKGDATAEELAFTAELPEIQAMRAGDFDGTIPVKDLAFGPLTLPAIDYSGGGMRVSASGATVGKITADASVTLKTLPGKGLTMTSLDVTRLDMPELVGTELAVTLPVGGQATTIGLPKATLTGFHMEDVHLSGFDAKSLETAEGYVTADMLRLDLGKQLPMGLEADGHLTVTTLYANAMKDGDLEFGLGDIDPRALGLTKESMEAAASDYPLLQKIIARGGRVTQSGAMSVHGSYQRVDKKLSADVGLGDVGLADIHYVAKGSRLDVGSATLKGTTISASVDFGDDGAKRVSLDAVKAQSLVGKGIHYESSALKDTGKVDADGNPIYDKTTQSLNLKRGTLSGIEVSGLMPVGDHALDLGISVKSGDVSGFNAELTKNGAKTLQVNANAQVEGLKVDVKDDDLTVDVERVSGQAAGRIGAKTTFGARDVTGKGTHVEVTDMGGKDQSVTAHMDELKGTKLYYNGGKKENVHASGTFTGVDYTQQGEDYEAKVERFEGRDMGGRYGDHQFAANMDATKLAVSEDETGRHIAAESVLTAVSYGNGGLGVSTTDEASYVGVEKLKVDQLPENYRGGKNAASVTAKADRVSLPAVTLTGKDESGGTFTANAPNVSFETIAIESGALEKDPRGFDTATNVKVGEVYLGGGGSFTYAWVRDAGPQRDEAGNRTDIEKTTEEMTYTEKMAAVANNPEVMKKRDEMRADPKLGAILQQLNGTLTVTLDHDFLPGAAGHPRFELDINDGVLDVSNLYVLGGMGIDIDYWDAGSGRTQVAIDWPFGGGYVLADRTGPGAATENDQVALQDIIGTQAHATSEYDKDDIIEVYDKEIAKYERLEKRGKLPETKRVHLQRFRNLKTQRLLALDNAAKASRTQRVADIEEAERALEALREEHGAGSPEVRAAEAELLSMKKPSMYGAHGSVDLKVLNMSADLRWGRPGMDAVEIGGMMVKTDGFHLDFHPLSPTNYAAETTIQKLDVTKKDGSLDVKVGSANAGFNLDQLLPNGFIDVLSAGDNDGMGNDLPNPFQARLRPGAQLKNVEITTRSKSKDNKPKR